MNLYIEINSSKMFAGNDKTLSDKKKTKKKKVKMKNWRHFFIIIIFTKPKK